jgi:uncharacterized protein involved in exopolysaccharide biosynthesis
MNDSANKRTMLGYDVDLVQLVHAIWTRRKLVFGFVAGALFIALVYLHIATYLYTATLMVSPVLSSSSDNLSGKLGGLSGLASLAGINVGQDQGTQAFMLYQQGLYSRDVADELAKDPDILHVVYRNQWDAGTQQWVKPSGPIWLLARLVKGAIGIPLRSWQPPDGALLQEYIADNVTLDSDPQKPVVTITYRDKDPAFAVKFLRELDRAVDNKLRQNALVRANQYVNYLAGQLATTTNADIRESLISTLTDQEKTKMMASATAPYAAQPFGLPSASRKPTDPKPFLVLAAAIFVGGLMGIFAAVWMPPLRWGRPAFLKRLGSRFSVGAR